MAKKSKKAKIEPAARAEQAGAEAGHDVPALVLEGHRARQVIWDLGMVVLAGLLRLGRLPAGRT